jgi:hypothetical protein
VDNNSTSPKSKFGLSQDERPVAVRYYKLIPKGKEILQNLLDKIK